MSAHMKKHYIDAVAKISWHGGLYVVPVEVMDRYKVVPEIEYTSW